MSQAVNRAATSMSGPDFDRWMTTWSQADKWELHDGYVIGMAGGTQIHDTIASNLGYALRPLRPKGCREHRDVVLRSPANADLRVFADVLVRCGPVQDEQSWVDDPVAVFEVLSQSTWRSDQGYKRDEYFKIETLKHYVVVYQTEVRLEVWTRADDETWPTAPLIVNGLAGQLQLSAFDLTIPMHEIYADTELAAAA